MPYWFRSDGDEEAFPGSLVSCDPKTPFISVAMVYRNGKYRPGYSNNFMSQAFTVLNDVALCMDKPYYVLVGNDVAFFPANEVPEGKRFVACNTEKSVPVYVGSICLGVGEEYCGPVIDGVCYVHIDDQTVIKAYNNHYKILAFSNGS